MAKKMLTVKVDEATIELLKKMAESQSRSQGGQVDFLIKKEAKELGIDKK